MENTGSYRNQMKIASFRGAYGFLSNFGGKSFAMVDPFPNDKLNNCYDDPSSNVPNLRMPITTAEHHFQALKTVDMQERAWVYGAPTAKMARSRGRMVTMRENWHHLSLLAMAKIIEAKFAVPKNRSDLVIHTAGFTLIEHNTRHDNIWGDCQCPRCRKTSGENRLGQLLMRERDLILSGKH